MELALLGRDISLSFSPALHALLDSMSGEKNLYSLIDVGKLGRSVFEKLNLLDGYNVTSPYKCEMASLLGCLDDSALSCGAVNTVVTLRGKAEQSDEGEVRGKGYNTDGAGLCEYIRASGKKAGRVLIIGFGGAAKAAADAFLRSGSEVSFAVRNVAGICGKEAYIKRGAAFFALGNESGKFDLLVNATPVGRLTDGKLISDPALLMTGEVIDMNYGRESFLSAQCRRLGVPYCDGIGMLVWQAILSRRIWGLIDLGKRADEAIHEIRRIWKDKK